MQDSKLSEIDLGGIVIFFKTHFKKVIYSFVLFFILTGALFYFLPTQYSYALVIAPYDSKLKDELLNTDTISFGSGLSVLGQENKEFEYIKVAHKSFDTLTYLQEESSFKFLGLPSLNIPSLKSFIETHVDIYYTGSMSTRFLNFQVTSKDSQFSKDFAIYLYGVADEILKTKLLKILSEEESFVKDQILLEQSVIAKEALAKVLSDQQLKKASLSLERYYSGFVIDELYSNNKTLINFILFSLLGGFLGSVLLLILLFARKDHSIDISN